MKIITPQTLVQGYEPCFMHLYPDKDPFSFIRTFNKLLLHEFY